MRVELIAIERMCDVAAGVDLAALIADTAAGQGTPIESGDVLIVTQKIVSKAEGRTVHLADVVPSSFAVQWAELHGTDARLVELVLRESRRIVRMDRGIIISETRQGLVCANAGVDVSNVDGGKSATLLPEDADRSARDLRERLERRLGCTVAVVISDTFGRPWREGQINVAIGVAGMKPLTHYTDAVDPHGYALRASIHAVADELAAAAGLVGGKLRRVPVVVVGGVPFESSNGDAKTMVRRPRRDLFR
jgi:coenzyme F420-0:L-glutamate ligase / coenzyme F420-1:gamma-L-glutamate ligase